MRLGDQHAVRKDRVMPGQSAHARAVAQRDGQTNAPLAPAVWMHSSRGVAISIAEPRFDSHLPHEAVADPEPRPG